MQKVREAAERLRSARRDRRGGLDPDAPSTACAIWTPIALEGLVAQMMHGNGMGFNWEGLYTTSLLDAHANWRARAERALAHAEDLDAGRRVLHQALPRPLLRQGAEPRRGCCARPTTRRWRATICC